uniref:mitochondrial import inner membrane translocase subunit TIM14-3-like n=1 Tax=Erigeron canadensis TaxID=72917 RepID=UPI001CB973FC|nr:mitochondrial import inner membrane translocase subunit TIM14-3-like [Erigeron canadensis]
MTSVFVAGLAVATGATAARYGIVAWNSMKSGAFSKLFKGGLERQFYKGGFEPHMTRREAALILGIRESRATDKIIRDAYRKVMVANHPDAGGSHYLASKIGEAKDMMMKKSRNPDSAF